MKTNEITVRTATLARTMLVCTLLASGCSATWGAEHRSTIRAVNAVTGAAAAVTMAADWCQTRTAAESWGTRVEGGMLAAAAIGSQPSSGRVDVYFAVTTAVLAGSVQLLPERYRWLAYGAIAGVEASTVRGNLATTRCGPVGM